ncbi:MAG: methyltransferase [Okeania sp. SIO2F4]|uniref:methyltransferase n=1 Tax=Okeania sp. SIO2F4 TaxID=2607790 RepID=UPI001429DBBE|nr:methyltransferase [Okeania sp. SIO2F4]NES05671.1 methyltransferase [Okeania sp. SIO2F4]
MNAEKKDFNNKLIIDNFIQDQTRNPEKINLKIHPQDEMYLYALKNTNGRKDEALLRYFSNGKRILDAVKQIVEWYFDGFENISSFLDFASGYGRFSRFLLQEIPIDKIWVSDIYPGAVEFQKQEFSVAGIVSTNAPEDYQINQKFDCIFACSFFSHTPQKTFTGWLEKLYSCLTENGILIFSTHDLSLMTIETDVEAEEIYFTPESESLFLKTEDYGVTYVGEKWVGKVIQKVTQGKGKWHRIKRGLCGYHDLYIVWNNLEGRRKKEEVFIKSEVRSQKLEVGKQEALTNLEFGIQKSEVKKKEVESKKEKVGEQIDELLNFHCHPDGGCKQIKMTGTGDIYLEGWAADINPEEKVEKILVLANGKEVGSCCPKHEGQSQRYEWSCTINSQNLSADDIILVKIINNFNLERVVNISPVNNIALLPPSHLLLRISGNPSTKAFISSFDDLRYTVKNYLQIAGFNFNQFENILDFGCGVGRYLMAFEPELLPNQKLFGCDVFAECAEWCQENIKFATVKHNDIQPPLPFENNQFDLINAISVFTHLSLDLQHFWAWDIYRVLRPGGILFMTLHGPQFFPIVYDIFRSGNAHKAEMYSIGEEGLFLYLDHQGETDGQGQHTIAAVHTPTAYQEIFSMFKHIKRFPQSNLANGQDLYILQKPISGSLVSQPLSIKSKLKSQKPKIFMDSEVRIQNSEVFINSEVTTQNLEVKNFAKTEDVRNTKEEIIGNINSEVTTQNLEVKNFAKTEDVRNTKEEIIGNINSEVTTQNLEVKNFAKTEDVGNAKEEIIGNINSEVTTQNLEVKNFAKTEDVGNAKKQIIGKKIEVEKILISGNQETKNLSEKIFSDSQTKSQVATKVEEIPLYDHQETENFPDKILSETQSNKQVITKVEEIPLYDHQETENFPDKILSETQSNKQVTREVEELPLSNDGKTENFPDKIFSDSHQCQTEIKFQIEGQKRFRVYPQIQPIGTYSIACEIEIINSKNGENLVQKTIPLNNKNIFGKTNYGVIEIEIPEYSGEVIVRLKTVITDRITLPPEQEVLVSWNFANFA